MSTVTVREYSVTAFIYRIYIVFVTVELFYMFSSTTEIKNKIIADLEKLEEKYSSKNDNPEEMKVSSVLKQALYEKQ